MRLAPFLFALGVTLLLGGFGHSVGVIRLYFIQGFPETNRILLDIWIAEAQIVGGASYVAAASALNAGRPWRIIALIGAATVIGYAAAFAPVLFYRAPWPFRIPATAYLTASVIVAVAAVRKPCGNSK